jgi:hypothetical protein
VCPAPLIIAVANCGYSPSKLVIARTATQLANAKHALEYPALMGSACSHRIKGMDGEPNQIEIGDRIE